MAPVPEPIPAPPQIQGSPEALDLVRQEYEELFKQRLDEARSELRNQIRQEIEHEIRDEYRAELKH